jgi:hypothetical protein
MSLLGFQSVLSRILVDANFRDQFMCCPRTACEEYRLSPSEFQSLCGIDKGRLALHSRKLLVRRIHLALRALPLTKELLETYTSRIAEPYARFVVPRPGVAAPAYREGLTLCDFLLSGAAADVGLPEFVNDIVRFDRAALELVYSELALRDAQAAAQVTEAFRCDSTTVLVPGRHVTALQFASDFREALVTRRSENFPVPRPVPLNLILMRRPDTPDVRTIVINDAVLDLINRFDGTRSCRDVVSSFSAGGIRRARNALARLYKLGLFLRRAHALHGD